MRRNIQFALIGIYGLATTAIFIAALLIPSFRPVAYAPMRELVLPPPAPVELLIYYSTEKEEWLDQVMLDFERANLEVNGRPIEITMEKYGSREMYLSVMDGNKPDVISPASSLQIALLQDLSQAKLGYQIVNPNNSNQCRSVVESPLVLVAWAERAAVLWGQQPGADIWKQLQVALINPQGWAAYGHPDWGYVKFGQTNPLSSNSGFMTILLLTYDYQNKTSSLTATDILSDPEYQEWFLGFQETISHFGNSTGTYMNDIVAYGPSTYDIVAVYEATAIEHIQNALGRYGDLQIYYPPATVMSDHPFCVLEADWVTPEKDQAAQLFIDFLLSQDAQEKALLDHGFRPVIQNIPLEQNGSPFVTYQANGIHSSIPPEVELPPGNVLDTLLNFWNRNIQP